MSRKIMAMIAGILGFLLCLQVLSVIFQPKWMDDTCTTLMADGFYAEESFDVVFFGTSQVLFGITPMEIYDSYGLKTYDCATGGQSIVDTYYWVRETIDRYHPPVVVVEIFGVIDEGAVTEPSIREAVDSMKMGVNKLLAIRDTLEIYEIDSDYLSFLIPLLRYHDRWNELKTEDFLYPFHKSTSAMKGYVPSTKVFVDNSALNGLIEFDPSVDPIEVEGYQTEYLEKIIAYCKDTDTELVLLKTPIYLYASEQHNLVSRIAEKYQIPFVDMNAAAERGNIDRVDFDGLPHLNLSGAKKTSHILGGYLCEHYPFLLERVDANRADERWQEELKSYRKQIQEMEEEMNQAIEEAMKSEEME